MIKDFKDMYTENVGKNFVAICHGSYMNTIACMFTNNLNNTDAGAFSPDNNSIALLDFFINKNEYLGESKEFIDVKLTAYNMILHR